MSYAGVDYDDSYKLDRAREENVELRRALSDAQRERDEARAAVARVGRLAAWLGALAKNGATVDAIRDAIRGA